MDEIEVAEHRMRVHPAFTGGPADEGYWLDSLQWALKSIGTYESMVERYAARLERNPEQAEWYIRASLVNRLYWDVLEVFVREMWTNGRGLRLTLIEWWMNATTGVIQKPSLGGKRTRRNFMRDLLIVATVNAIHEATDLPYEFDEPKPPRKPRTACHAVAERLAIPYATIRTIWRKSRLHLDRARESGRIPVARKRRRRS